MTNTRVLLVSGSYPDAHCGVGDYTRSLAKALAATGTIDVGVLSHFGANSPHDAGIERLIAPDNWSIRHLPNLVRSIDRWHPDIVHLQYPTQGYDATLLPSLVPGIARLKGAASVRTWHEGFSGRQMLNFSLQALPRGPAIVVRPDFEQHLWPAFRHFDIVRKRRLIVGASSIPPSTMADDERSAHRRIWVGDAANLIVFFGFIYPAKGVHLLFEALDPSVDRLVIAGSFGDFADYREQISALADERRWRGRVLLPGYLDEAATADLLAAADMVVLPFLAGGGVWNSSIHATRLQGTPLVTTSQTIRGYNAADGVFYVPPDDGAALREAVDFMRGRGHMPLSREDDWTRVAREHIAVYQAALADRQ